MADAGESSGATRPAVTRGGIALLYLPLFTVALGYGAVLPIIPSVLGRLHGAGGGDLSLHAGLLTGIYIGAFVVAAPVWGRVTDRLGPRPVLVTGLLGYAGATVWFGLVESLEMAYVVRFIAGAFAAGLLPATSALIAARCRGEERARHLGWVSAASIVGYLVGPALTGGIHSVLAGPSIQTSSLHLTVVPIWTTGIIAVASAFGVAWSIRSPQGETAVLMPVRAGLQESSLTRNWILLLSAVGAFGVGAFEVGLSLQSLQRWRWSTADLSWLFAVCSLVMLAIQLTAFAPLRRRMRPEATIGTGFLLMAGGFVLLAGTDVYGVVVGLVSLIALGSGLLLPALSVATADRAGEGVGGAIGNQNAASNLGQATGSAVAGYLFTALPAAAFAVIAGLMVAAAALVWRIAYVRRYVSAA